MSRRKCYYYHSNPLVLTIAVSSFLSLALLFSNYIYAQNESIQTSPQEPNQIGEQEQTSQNGTGNDVDNQTIIMTTDKTVYSPGHIVNITISNTGEEQLTFPNSALGLVIRSLATNESYPIYSAQVITILNANDSRSVTWDQMGINGSQVPPGDYVASLSSEPSTANVIFSISQ